MNRCNIKRKLWFETGELILKMNIIKKKNNIMGFHLIAFSQVTTSDVGFLFEVVMILTGRNLTNTVNWSK